MKKILLVLLISNTAYASCFTRDVLPVLRPGAQWSMKEDDYDSIMWFSKQTIPSKDEVTQAIADCRVREAIERSQKDQAKIDLNSIVKTDTERINAIIKFLDLNK